jgi:RimJ/RimL family protein N-acetyltransferase
MLDTTILEIHQKELADVSHMRYSRQRKINHSHKTTLDYINKLNNSGGKFYFLKQISDESIIGTITIKPKDIESADVGILIYKKFSNLGFGTEAFQMAHLILIQMGFKIMCAGTAIDHFVMRRIFEKTGMRITESRNFRNGKFVKKNIVYFEVKLV